MSRYSPDEVRALVESWSELRHDPRLWLLIRYADLTVALRNSPPKEYQAVLLCGLIGLPIREAATHMGVGHNTMHYRYTKGIDWLTTYLNGGYRD